MVDARNWHYSVHVHPPLWCGLGGLSTLEVTIYYTTVKCLHGDVQSDQCMCEYSLKPGFSAKTGDTQQQENNHSL